MVTIRWGDIYFHARRLTKNKSVSLNLSVVHLGLGDTDVEYRSDVATALYPFLSEIGFQLYLY